MNVDNMTLTLALRRHLFAGSLFALPLWASATGMVPESSVVIIEESDGEAAMNVTNTDAAPMLLTTTVRGLAQDSERLVLVSPPAIRVDGGKTQKVRFILRAAAPLKTERLRRVIFSGIPPQSHNKNAVRMSISQNLPVIIRPAGLPREESPWTQLRWEISDGGVSVINPSPYVVRFSQRVQALPDNIPLTLPQPYILPEERLRLTVPEGEAARAISQIRIYPATTWGYAVNHYDAPVSR